MLLLLFTIIFVFKNPGKWRKRRKRKKKKKKKKEEEEEKEEKEEEEEEEEKEEEEEEKEEKEKEKEEKKEKKEEKENEPLIRGAMFQTEKMLRLENCPMESSMRRVGTPMRTSEMPYGSRKAPV